MRVVSLKINSNVYSLKNTNFHYLLLNTTIIPLCNGKISLIFFWGKLLRYCEFPREGRPYVQYTFHKMLSKGMFPKGYLIVHNENRWRLILLCLLCQKFWLGIQWTDLKMLKCSIMLSAERFIALRFCLTSCKLADSACWLEGMFCSLQGVGGGFCWNVVKWEHLLVTSWRGSWLCCWISYKNDLCGYI